MRSSRRVALLLVSIGYVAAGVSAQKLNLTSDQKYVFIVADQATKLQTALDEATGVGFEVVLGSRQGLLLKRTTERGAQSTYRAIIGKFGELEKALNAGADAGFIVLPQTFTSYETDATVTMGRLPAGSPKPAYRMVEWDGSFEKNLSAIGAKSIRPIGVIAPASGMAFKLGRPGRLYVAIEIRAEDAGSSAARESGWLRQVSAVRTSTLERELNEAASTGYRVVGGSLMSVALQKVDTSTTTYSYRVIGAVRGETLGAEIQQAGRDGYRVLSGAIMANPGSRAETVLVMERASTPSRSYEYTFVTSSPEASAELVSLGEKAFTPVALVAPALGGPTYSIILERAQ